MDSYDSLLSATRSCRPTVFNTMSGTFCRKCRCGYARPGRIDILFCPTPSRTFMLEQRIVVNVKLRVREPNRCGGIFLSHISRPRTVVHLNRHIRLSSFRVAFLDCACGPHRTIIVFCSVRREISDERERSGDPSRSVSSTWLGISTSPE